MRGTSRTYPAAAIASSHRCSALQTRLSAASIPVQVPGVPEMPAPILPHRLERMIGRDDVLREIALNELQQRTPHHAQRPRRDWARRPLRSRSPTSCRTRVRRAAFAFSIWQHGQGCGELVAGTIAWALGLVVHQSDPTDSIVRLPAQPSPAAGARQLRACRRGHCRDCGAHSPAGARGQHPGHQPMIAACGRRADLRARFALQGPPQGSGAERRRECWPIRRRACSRKRAAAAGPSLADIADDDAECSGGDMRQARWHCAGDRTRRRTGRHTWAARDGDAARRPAQAGVAWPADRASAAANPRCNAGLELWSDQRERADPSPSPCHLCCPLHVAGRGHGRRRAGRSGRAHCGYSLEQLVAKSLIAVRPDGAVTRYRLLDTTRTYATQKLAESGEATGIARRHARYVQHALETTAEDSDSGDQVLRSRARTLLFSDARAALKWAFANDEGAGLRVPLAVACSRLFVELNLLDEARLWSSRAVTMLDNSPDGGHAWELELQATLGHAFMFTERNSDQAETALRRGLEIVEAICDRASQFKLLARLNMFYRRTGDYRLLLPLALEAERTAQAIGDPGRNCRRQRPGRSFLSPDRRSDARRSCILRKELPGGAALRPHAARPFCLFADAADFRSPACFGCAGFPDQAVECARPSDGGGSTAGRRDALHRSVLVCVALWLGRRLVHGRTNEPVAFRLMQPATRWRPIRPWPPAFERRL